MKSKPAPIVPSIPFHSQTKVIERAFQVRHKLFEATAMCLKNGKDLAKTPKH